MATRLLVPVLILFMASPLFGWSVPLDITNGADYEVGQRVDYDSSSNLHMVWYGNASESTDWEIMYQYFNGTAWSTPQNISPSFAAHPDIAVDGSGNLHVVWDQNGNPEEVYYRKRTGTTWGSIVNLSNTSGRSITPRIAVDSTGNSILVVWHESNQVGDDYDIMARKCTNGTWGNLENVSGDSDLSRSADLVIDAGGNYHVVWENLDAKNIVYRKRNADNTWGGKTAVDTTSGRSMGAAIAISSNGFIHVAWHDDNSDWDILYRYFNGTSWSSVANVSNNPGVTDCVAAITTDSNNDVHIAWKDYHDIYYAHTVSGAWRPWYKLSTGENQGDPAIARLPNGQLHVPFASRDTGSWDILWTYTTVPDLTPPSPVSSFNVVAGAAQTTLNWTNPGNVDYTGTMIRYKTTGYPTGPTDGTLLLDWNGSPDSTGSYVHTGLTNGTTYYYCAYARDAEPNYAAPAQSNATPSAGPKENLLANPYIINFTSGVANSWTAYRANDNNAVTFGQDTSNYFSSPSQSLSNISSSSLPTTGLSAAGINQVVTGTTAGKVYQLVGYQDIYNSTYSAAGQRYLMNFGINPSGGTTPGTPTTDGTIGGCKWMTSAQALWNNAGGSPVKFSGFHRSTAAYPASGTSISVWTGLTISNPGVKDSAATKFNADHCYLFEWDLPANASLVNGNFESARIDLQDGGDIIPTGWVPAGGGCGQNNAWTCDTYSKRSGTYGMQIGNRRGAHFSGIMQRISTVAGHYHTFQAWVKASGQDSTNAAIGIDPYGGADITSANITWTTMTSSTWTQLTVNATAQANAVTLFLRASNSGSSTSNYHWGYFDDCTHTQGTPQNGSITGVVKDDRNNVLSGAVVSTTSGGYSTSSAADGTYTLSGVTPATYSVQAVKSGYQTTTVGNIVVPSGGTVTANLTMPWLVGTISGYVLDNTNAPISGATVSTNTGGYTTASGADGFYTLVDVLPATYNMTASKTNYYSQTVNSVVVTGLQTTVVDFTLTPVPGTISGTVTNECGFALADVTVFTNTGGYSATTAANGTYTISNVVPGTYNVTAAKSGYVAETQNGKVVTAGQTTTANFALSGVGGSQEVLLNGSIEGGFWDTGWGGGSAIPNSWTGWYNPGDFNCFDETSVIHAGAHSARTTISSGGDSGTGGYKRGIYQNVNVGANANFTITVWARHTNGNCPSIMCWNPEQNVSNPQTAYTAGRYKWVTTDNWGQLNIWVSNTLTGTAPASGYITLIVGGAHHGGGGSGTVYIDDVSVAAETTGAVSGTISGTVRDTNNNVISGATVSTSTGGYTTTSAADGSYTLSDVAAGTYNVTASKTGYLNQTQNGVQVSSCQTSTVNFNLQINQQPVEHMANGNMEGGFWDTGWGGGSKIPNSWTGWYNPGDFNCFDETGIYHGGAHSARTTISAGGDSGTGGYKRSIYQNVNVGANAGFTITVWARHTNGNCPSIMCWNPEQNVSNPQDAYLAGRYQWVTTDNWGQLNTWVSRTMTGTAPSSGWITVMVGGAHHGGGGVGTVYVDDCSVTTP